MEKAELLAIENDRLRRLATYASVSVALVLIAAKIAAWFLTDSVAMLSSLLDSTIDLIASLVTAYGVAAALRPPDREHRFGHGKAEPLAALAQAAFIIGSSVLLGYEALHRFYHPQAITNLDFGYGTMVLAIMLTAALVLFQRYVIRRTHSMAIGADRLHYVGDLAVNAAVIAGGLIFSAHHIAMHALIVLMDREVPDTQREKIKSIVRAHPAVRGIHDMRTRSDSDRIFIEVHVELDPDMKLKEAHLVADGIERALIAEFPNADVLIHEDPAGLIEHRLDEQIAARSPPQ